jgi:hypothetical protein
MSADTPEFRLPPEEGPEAYYGAGFLDDLVSRRDAGASPAELIDLLCLADIGPIIEQPSRHLPYYVQLLTADAASTAAIGEGARIYDRFNERVLAEIFVGTPIEGNREAQRALRIAFAMNAHGVLVECVKGEDPASLLELSRRLRRSLVSQLLNESSSTWSVDRRSDDGPGVTTR